MIFYYHKYIYLIFLIIYLNYHFRFICFLICLRVIIFIYGLLIIKKIFLIIFILVKEVRFFVVFNKIQEGSLNIEHFLIVHYEEKIFICFI